MNAALDFGKGFVKKSLRECVLGLPPGLETLSTAPLPLHQSNVRLPL